MKYLTESRIKAWGWVLYGLGIGIFIFGVAFLIFITMIWFPTWIFIFVWILVVSGVLVEVIKG